MPNRTRQERIKQIFPDLPAYRWKQINHALCDGATKNWSEISVLPASLRSELERSVPWMSCHELHIHQSKSKDTFKAVLTTDDTLPFETVLMANARDQWTICVSSQVGCAMACSFCATGTMGLKRGLTSDEIVDQFRFWKYFLSTHASLPQRISNIVFMGMGEPMANYESVKNAITILLKNTDLGPTHITVSSVGLLPQLEHLLEDPEWPPVRIAISLHSATTEQRKQIVPTSTPEFLPRLAKWTKDYATRLGNRRHHITFEYILLKGINDREEDAKNLARYLGGTAARKVNVIPYNNVSGKSFTQSEKKNIDRFKSILLAKHITVTQRKTMGEDIAAACGQLVTRSITKRSS